ncbi:TPA: hypothetical protein ACH3X2_005484 [Trebouxia sp. C0005]|nr:MAG: hypothetical protein FRX49_10053 [Trebouxia sp. A1-2]
MTSDGYVLLYECYAGDYGYESVALRFLPFNHPFGTLLLHKGSRQAAEMHHYKQDIWRRHLKSYQPWTPPDLEAYLKGAGPGEKLQAGIHFPGGLSIDEQGWCRKQVCWSSVYGAPSELHLILYDSIQAWVAQQQALNSHLRIFDSPKTLVGALRLDSDVVGSEDITRDIRNQDLTLYATCPITGVETVITDKFSPTESGDGSGDDDIECNNKEVESYICTPKNADADLVAAEEPGGAATAVCGAAAPAITVTDHPHQCEEGVECNPACQPPAEDAEWMNQPQYLKDIVLSCTSDEVEETLAAFYHFQACDLFRKYKDELLQCLASRTIASGA